MAKEKILDDATARATKAERAIRKATKETAHLLATGGVLLNPRDDDAAAGVVSASWAFRDLKHQVGSLRDAAATGETLRDRLAAAEASWKRRASRSRHRKRSRRPLERFRSLREMLIQTQLDATPSKVSWTTRRGASRTTRLRSWPRFRTSGLMPVSTPSTRRLLDSLVDLCTGRRSSRRSSRTRRGPRATGRHC